MSPNFLYKFNMYDWSHDFAATPDNDKNIHVENFQIQSGS